MEMAYDFAETKDTAIIFIYRPPVGDIQISPVLEGPRKLKLWNDITISLYKDVYPDIRLIESRSRVEVHLRKVEMVRWGGINGRPADKPQDDSKETMVEDSGDEENPSVMDLFSKIYQRSGDDVRRAMEKSFYESEGTVLSTDWDQVKSKKITRED
ncbi:Hsp90-associated protein [Encephalitozoon cuniculi]|nr:Hsp90-associated protein [Encephalitozoon cuniculi]